MLVVTITVAVAAVAVLAAIVVVAVGGGGQLSAEHPDHPPLALPGRRAIGGTDAALLRLPLGLWGYHKQITDEALQRFAYELTERDTRIAVLEQELAEARQGHGGDTRNGRLAPPATRGDMPVMGEDPMATHTDARPALPALSALSEDPPGTRTDGEGAPQAGHASVPPGDPWKTIVDRPAAEGEEKADVEDAPTEPKDDGE